MSFTTASMPIKGLRQIQGSAWVSDGVYGSTFLVPYPQKFSTTENQVVKELPGGDVLADKSVTIKSMQITMGWARIKLSQLADFLGANFAITGSTPNQRARLTRKTSDVGGFFRLVMRAAYIGSEYPSGDYLLRVFKCKLVGSPKIEYATEEYATVEVEMEAFETDSGDFYEIDINETGAVLTESSDVTAPTVSSITPADNATGVLTSATVSITFAEEVQENDAVFLITDITSATAPVEKAFTVDWSSNPVVVLTPTSAFTTAKTYNVRISTDLRDVAGNRLASAYNSQFTIA